MSHHKLIEENRSHWDKLAPIHARGSGSPFYRIEEFLAGETKLAPWELDEVGPVTGKSLLHLQCHIGLDTLSWAREGAAVTGLDFSPASIKEARLLAKECKVEARFVEALVQDAAEVLDHELFDIIYTGRGAICWLPDLDIWAEQCAALCQPGGIFYMEESHPTLDLFDFKPDSGGKKTLQPHYDPFQCGPVSETIEGTYADRDAATGLTTSHAWDHSIGEVVNALTKAGFDFVHLHEREFAFFEPWPGVFEPHSPNLWKFKDGEVRFPVSYTLKMRRRAGQ
jgi:SAM-dependent methyltransferase